MWQKPSLWTGTHDSAPKWWSLPDHCVKAATSDSVRMLEEQPEKRLRIHTSKRCPCWAHQNHPPSRKAKTQKTESLSTHMPLHPTPLMVQSQGQLPGQWQGTLWLSKMTPHVPLPPKYTTHRLQR
jgi:hypothetical protein